MADPDNAITEGNELNNAGYAKVSVGILPDFSLSSEGITFSHTDLTLGFKVTISALVSNIGLAPANTLINFYDGEPIEANLIGQVVTDIIQPQASQTLNLDWYPPAGTHTITVEIDPANSIPELDETNNLASKEVKFTIPGTVITLYKVIDGQQIETDTFGAYQSQKIVLIHPWENGAVIFRVVNETGDVVATTFNVLLEKEFTWYTSNNPPGRYTAIAYVVDRSTGNLLEKKDKTFTIEPTIGIKYTQISTDKDKLIAGKPQALTLRAFLGNGSNVETVLNLNYKVVSPSGILVISGTKQITLSPDTESSTIDLVTFTDKFQEIGSYTIDLQVVYNSSLLATANSSITSVPLIRIEPEKIVSPDRLHPGSQGKVRIEIKLRGIQQ